MKRFISLVLILVLTFSCHIALAQEALDSMLDRLRNSNELSQETVPSDEELISSLRSLTIEMQSRGMILNDMLTKGTYTVGVDFPQGYYLLSPLASSYATVELYSSASNLSDGESIFLSDDYYAYVVELHTDNVLVVKSNAIRLETYYNGYLFHSGLMDSEEAKLFSKQNELPIDTTEYPVRSFNILRRYPEKYKFENIQFTGIVQQVMDGSDGWSYLRVSTDSFSDEEFWVYVPENVLPDFRILEDDLVTVYGSLYQEVELETVLGAKVTMLTIVADYLQFH